jgi:predicted nucleic acid-binding protein
MRTSDLIVVDASVAIKWVVDEEGSEFARQLLPSEASASGELYAPSIILIETHYALSRRFNKGLVVFEQLAGAVDYIKALVTIRPLDVPLIGEAQMISLGVTSLSDIGVSSQGRPFSIYDSLYIAQALSLGAKLVTADRNQAAVARRLHVEVVDILSADA